MNSIQKKLFENGWKQRDNIDYSICGSGSLLASCNEYINLINDTNITYNVKTINDIGCGDLNYIKHTNIDINKIDYLGYDYVSRIELSTEKFKINDKSFNICSDIPRNCDLCICKDTLNHLDPKTQILSAINNIKKTCKYLIITNYIKLDNNIADSNLNGNWIKINFNIEPYNLNPYLIRSLNVKHIRPEHKDICVSLYKFN